MEVKPSGWKLSTLCWTILTKDNAIVHEHSELTSMSEAN